MKLIAIELLLILLWMCIVESRKHCKNDADCNNHGKCYTNVGDCVCHGGYAGDFCERPRTACDSNQCINGGYCTLINNETKMLCVCDKRFKGVFCQEDVDECENPNACEPYQTCKNHKPNSSRSVEEDPGYMCTCVPEIDGLCPGQPAGDCTKKRCENGEWKNCSCHCKDGYGGDSCKLLIPTQKEFFESNCQNKECYRKYGDGVCNDECNNSQCMYDGLDCAATDVKFCEPDLNCTKKFHNGMCNRECVSEECGFDGGDCDEYDRFDPVPSGTLVLQVNLSAKPHHALALLHDLEEELSRLLFTLVKATRDEEGLVLYSYIVNLGDPVRVLESDCQNQSLINSMLDISYAYFELDVQRCARDRTRNQSTRCFDSARSAAAFLSVQLRRNSSTLNRAARKITSVVLHEKDGTPTPPSNVLNQVVIAGCVTTTIVLALCCVFLLRRILRSRTGKRKLVHAQVWTIPGELNSMDAVDLYPKPLQEESVNPPNSTSCPPPLKKVAVTIDFDGYLGEPSTNAVEMTFLKAVRNRNYVVVRAMLQKNVLVISECHDEQGLRPFHHAIANNDARMLELLLGCDKFDIFERNDQQQSAIVYAARVGVSNLDIIKMITDEILAQKTIDALEESVLQTDPFRSRYEEKLLARKHELLPLSCETDWKFALIDDKGRSALHYATLNNQSDVIRFLLEKGADVDLQDDNGDSSLHLAAMNGCQEACAALLNGRCSKNLLNNFGESAHYLAEKFGFTGAAVLISGFSPRTPPDSIIPLKKDTRPRPLKRSKTDSTLLPVNTNKSHHSELDRKDSISKLYTPIVTGAQKSNADGNIRNLNVSHCDADNGFSLQTSLCGRLPPAVRILTPREELIDENSFLTFRQDLSHHSDQSSKPHSTTPSDRVALASTSYTSGHNDSSVSSMCDSRGFV